MCDCICTVPRNEWKDFCDFVDIEHQKLISHSITRWLSLCPSLPRMLQMYPASHSYFMSIDKPTVILKRFSGNSLSELCLRHYDICNHLWLLQKWASSEYWEVKSIIYWGCIVFRHCEGEDSRETIRCTSQVKSALRKLREGKDHDCGLFMSDVSVLYKSSVVHLAK